LNDIKRRFREETFTRESIANVIHAHPELVLHHALFMFFYSADLKRQIRMLYVNFAMVQYPIDEAQRLMYAPRCNLFCDTS
jgi:glutamate dehydrogenase